MDSQIEKVVEVLDESLEEPASQSAAAHCVMGNHNAANQTIRRKQKLRELRRKHLYEIRNRGFVSKKPPAQLVTMTHALKKLTHNSVKFMENFDPERSNRERRKLSRKLPTAGKKPSLVYDERGWLLSNGEDLCDCMDTYCPGCHFPCPRCQSPKCGHECRVNRKWTYEGIEIDGTEIVLKPDAQLLKLMM